MIVTKETLPQLRSSYILLFMSKALALASPIVLKMLVDSMGLVAGSAGTATMAVAGGGTMSAPLRTGGKFVLWKACLAVLAWGSSRTLSTALYNWHMNRVVRFVQSTLVNISNTAFSHLQKLDVSYHKQGSRSSIFIINKALRSMETCLRFMFGILTANAVELGFITLALTAYCGPLYLANMMVTVGAYAWWTRKQGHERMFIVRDKKDIEKAQEFFQNESISNIETVKAFNGTQKEMNRYQKILNKLKRSGNRV